MGELSAAKSLSGEKELGEKDEASCRKGEWSWYEMNVGCGAVFSGMAMGADEDGSWNAAGLSQYESSFMSGTAIDMSMGPKSMLEGKWDEGLGMCTGEDCGK